MTKQNTFLKDIKSKILELATLQNIETDDIKTICYMLYKNSFIYVPEQLRSIKLIKNIVQLSVAVTDLISILVETHVYQTKKAYYSKLSKNIKVISLEYFEIEQTSDIVVLDEFFDKESFIFLQERYINIYENKIVFCVVNSPVLFLELIRSKIQLDFYIPIFKKLDKCNFYKKLIEDSNIVTFDTFQTIISDKNKYSYMIQYIENLDEKQKRFFEWLKINGLYDEKLWIKTFPAVKPLQSFKSDKLITLCKILKILKSRRNCLIVKDQKTAGIIKKIFSLSNKIAVIEIKKIIYEINLEIISFSDFLDFKEEEYDNIVFFDFFSVSLKTTKYILCGDNEKKLLKKFMVAEEIIEAEVLPQVFKKISTADFAIFYDEQMAKIIKSVSDSYNQFCSNTVEDKEVKFEGKKIVRNCGIERLSFHENEKTLAIKKNKIQDKDFVNQINKKNIDLSKQETQELKNELDLNAVDEKYINNDLHGIEKDTHMGLNRIGTLNKVKKGQITKQFIVKNESRFDDHDKMLISRKPTEIRENNTTDRLGIHEHLFSYEEKENNCLIEENPEDFMSNSKLRSEQKCTFEETDSKNNGLYQTDGDSLEFLIDINLKNETINTYNSSLIKMDKPLNLDLFNNQFHFIILFENRNFKNLMQKLSFIDRQTEFKKYNAKVEIQTENPLLTTFLLSKICESPVIYHPTLTQAFTYCIINSFSLGHLNFYNSFISKFDLYGVGYLFFNMDKIIFFYLSRQITIRLDIVKESVDETLFYDLVDEDLCLYFALKNYPNIFVLEDLTATQYEKLRRLQMVDKFIFLDNLEWKRASVIEFPQFEDAYDVKFKIDLNNGNRNVGNKDIVEPKVSKLVDFFEKIQKNTFEYKQTKNENNIDKLNKSTSTNEKITKFNTEMKNLGIYQFTIESLLNKLSQYDYRLFFINITQKDRSGKSLMDLRKYFQKIDFSDYYYLEILFTKKDRYIDNKIYNIEIFKDLNIKNLVNYLDANLTNRFFSVEKHIKNFRKASSKEIYKNSNNDKIIRQIIVTPFRVKCIYPQSYVSNRVLRNFDADKFIRVSFKDENENIIYKNNERNNIYVYSRIKNIMKDGIVIGERRYFFLAMSSSQLKLHSAWFITPYMFNKTLIGADYIRSWLGDLKSIHNIGKYAIRLGQGLSSTTETVEIQEINEINDIERNGYCFSDGIGQIGYDLAHEVIQYLNLKEIPSAFQIRIGGYKGVVSLMHNTSRSSIYDRNMKRKKTGLNRDRNIDSQQTIKDQSLFLRKSMKKYDSNYKFLEIITFSQNFACNLNRQIIIILEARGIAKEVFLQMQDKIISRFILSDPTCHIKRYAPDFPIKQSFSSERFFIAMLEPVLKKTFENLIRKTKIQVCKGRLLMGILDEFDVLEEDEIFIRCSPCVDCVCNNTKTLTITGKVAIAKNPCLHPGDLRIVKAVRKPELLYLKDVVVFSRKGSRPIFNMCSGSDLDGDLYFCTWDEKLIPKKQVEPFAYESKTVLYKQIVSIDDIINFYARFMHDNNLGLIANSHLALSDKLENGVHEEECIRLATLFNLGVDFPKTGFVPRLPDDLEPEAYPDFMLKKYGSYKSNKVLGIMFRRSFMFTELHYYSCECRGRPSTYIKNLYDFRCRNICKIINTKYKNIWYESRHFSEKFTVTLEKVLDYEKDTRAIFKSYKEEINMYLIKNGYKNECDAFLGFANENGNERRYDSGIREIARKYRKIILENIDSKLLHYKIFSLYIVTHSKCNEYNNSIIMIICDILSKYDDLLAEFLNEIKDNITKNEDLLNKIQRLSEFTSDIIYKKENVIEIDYNEFKKKNIKHSRFKLCDKIVFVESLDDISFLNDDKRSRKYHILRDFIIIPRYLSIYERYENKLSDSENMKELFLLFLAVRFFVLDDIRCLFEFFAYLTDVENSDNSKYRMCNKLIILSQDFYRKTKSEKMSGNLSEWIYTRDIEEKENRCNTILLISFIYSLNHQIGSKLITCEDVFFNEKETNVKSKKKRSLYFYKKSIGISINGMFDGSDLAYMNPYKGKCLEEHENSKKHVIRLLNPGICSVENYKDDLRKFMFQNAYIYKEELMHIKVKVIPGKFYYYNINTYSSNNNMEIKHIVDKTLFINDTINNTKAKEILNSCFINYHPLLEEENDIYIKKNILKVYNKDFYYVLHLSLNYTKYSIYYKYINDIFEVTKITKDRNISGRYIISQNEDALFEMIKEKVIYCKVYNIDSLEESENIFLKPLIFKTEISDIILFDYKKLIPDISKTTLDIVKQMNFGIIQTELISVQLKSMYKLDSNGRFFNIDKQLTSAFCSTEDYFRVINFKTFDNFFENTWRLFRKYFCDE